MLEKYVIIRYRVVIKMSSFETYDKNFQYFFHGTNNSDVESFFNKGLISDRGNNIVFTMYPIDGETIESSDLRTLEKQYCQVHDFDYCYVIKIPNQYMGWMIHRDNTIEVPIPIWIPTEQKGEFGKVSILCPHLICGVYSKQRNQIMPNPNYNPKYNPSGMQYAREQEENMMLSNHQDYLKWLKFSRMRNGMSPEELKLKDDNGQFWLPYLSQYEKIITEQYNPRPANLKK